MNKNTKKRVVIIMGAPGSGKGTQATLVSDKLSLYYLETSKLLEAAFNSPKIKSVVGADGKRYLMADEKKIWLSGELNSTPFTLSLISEKIKRVFEGGDGLLLAGSPRRVSEAEFLMPFLIKLYGKQNIKTVLLEISAQESIFRNSHRKICALMRHPILYSRENAKLNYCPIDGSKLMVRKGLDDPQTIKVRLETYKQETLPIIGYLKKNQFSVQKIDGLPAPAVVFNNILKTLGA
jgi:adenylate kinase